MIDLLSHWANDVLLWIGFGTLAGLTAKAILPGRDSGGTVATLLMGVGGTVVGCGLVALVWTGKRVSPLSLAGFVAATLGATILLVFHRLLAGRFFREEGTGVGSRLRPRNRKRITTVLTQDPL